MFAKLQRQIDRKNKHKSPKKFRFDVTVSSLEGIPATIKGCRIVWTRGSRSQTTQTTPVINGEQNFAAMQDLTLRARWTPYACACRCGALEGILVTDIHHLH